MKSVFHSLFIGITVLLWCLLLRPHSTFKDRNETHAGPGVKMDTLAKSPKAIPFDGRLHGNIQRFVFHSVPGGKLIIKSALWLHWSSDYRRRQASFSPLFQLMEFTRLSKWKFNWFFFPSKARVGYQTGCACVDPLDRKRKQKGKNKADGTSSAQLNLDQVIRWKNTFMWYKRHHLLVANWHTHCGNIPSEAQTENIFTK